MLLKWYLTTTESSYELRHVKGLNRYSLKTMIFSGSQNESEYIPCHSVYVPTSDDSNATCSMSNTQIYKQLFLMLWY